jgi:hypothetical protein
MWEIIGEVTGKKSNNNSCKINKLSSAGLTITGSRNIANEFNTFFCNVGEKIANDVEEKTIDPRTSYENRRPLLCRWNLELLLKLSSLV